MTRSRNGLGAVSLCAAGICLLVAPSIAEAGPLLDWLFQRNRSQAYAGAPAQNAYGSTTAGYGRPYTSNYALNGYQQNAYQGSGYSNQLGNGAAPFGATTNARQSYYRGQGNGLLPKRGLFGHGCSLFGNRNASLSANSSQTGSQLANNQVGRYQYGQATAYGGTGSSCPVGCQSGWCEQTVLRYMPQIAYRTDYQPVPVTTYKTTTTINPANGLPRTCTRPCTSYSWQARRVPYTTYRPVYTTVPVTDDCGCNANTSNAANPNGFNPNAANPNAYNPNAFDPNAANVAPQLPPGSGWQAVPPAGASFAPSQINANRVQANRLYQPAPTSTNSGWTAVGGCASCQNNTAGGQYGFGAEMNAGGFGGTVAGYTPSNATEWSSAPRASQWTPVDQYDDSATSAGFRGDVPRPSAWRRIPQGSYQQPPDSDRYREDLGGSGSSTSRAYSDTDIPWQPLQSSSESSFGSRSRLTVRGDEAYERPRIDPNVQGYRGDSYRGDSYDYDPEPLVPSHRDQTRVLVPVPKAVRPTPEVAPQSVEPLYHSDPRSVGGYDRVQANVGQPTDYADDLDSQPLFSGAERTQSVEERMFGTPGSSAARSDFHNAENFETRRETGYRTRAIHDNMRGGPQSKDDADVSTTDKNSKDTRWTTRRNKEQNRSSARYASVDIRWEGANNRSNDSRWLARNEIANSRTLKSVSNKID